MGSSLNNTDPSYQDSMELEYPPFDVYCKYADLTGRTGEPNAYKTGCDARLAQEEIPQCCCKCKGIKFKRKMPDVDSLFCVCGESKKIGETYCDFCQDINEIDATKPNRHEPKQCDRCDTILTNKKKRYCEPCRIVVDKEMQERKNAQKREKTKVANYGNN
jgi:hypothetical protein